VGPAGVIGAIPAGPTKPSALSGASAVAIKGVKGSAITQPATSLGALSGLNALDLSTLRVTFNVKNKLGKPDHADIQVYNASPQSRAYLSATGILGVALSAGYADEGTFLLFEGEIRSAPTHMKEDDYVTRLQTSDKTITIQSAHSNWVIEKNATLLSVITRLVTDINNNAVVIGGPSIGLGNAKQVCTPLPSLWPYASYTSGYTSTNLDDVCKSAGLLWTVSKGQLHLTDLGYSAGNGNPMQLSSSSGLIGSPGNDGKGVFTFETLMIPGIHINRIVQMDSKYVSGYYRIIEAHFQGDTHGKPWTIKCKALAAKGTAGAKTIQQGQQVGVLGY